MAEAQACTGNSPLIRCDRVTLYAGNPIPANSSIRQKRPPRIPLLQDITWAIQAGEGWAILGASGAGKTSLLRLLNRLAEPGQGRLFWQETSYAQVPVLQLRQQITYVPQEPRLLGMTVEQALRYPLQLRQLPEAEIRDRINQGCDRLSIPKQWRDRTELQLSLGERQWVAIARALLIEPKVLLLDEPTASLDAKLALTLQQVLSDRKELTWIVASHQTEWVRSLCPHLFYLVRGKRAEIADPPEWEVLQADLRQTAMAETDEWG